MRIVCLKQARLKNAKIIAEMARNPGPNFERCKISRVGQVQAALLSCRQEGQGAQQVM